MANADKLKYSKKQKLSLMDYIMKNPNYFNPRKMDDFSNMNEAMLFTKYIDQALDANLIGHYPKEGNYLVPNNNVTDLVRMTGSGSISNPKKVAKMTKELLKGM